MVKRHDLYFILNPFTGLIKIGISHDVEQRKYGLEHAAGVDLILLAVLEGGASHEQNLHAAFAPDRQRGEWFLPSDEMMALVENTADVPAFIRREWRRIERTWADEEQRKADLKAQRMAEVAAEKQAPRDAEAARKAAEKALKAAKDVERKRLKAEERKRQKVEAQGRATKLRAHHEEQAEWLDRTGLRPKGLAEAATKRLEGIRRRREQNMQLLGIRV